MGVHTIYYTSHLLRKWTSELVVYKELVDNTWTVRRFVSGGGRTEVSWTLYYHS